MRQRRGFTLVEAMVVMAIIAILVVVVVPQLTGVGLKARSAARASDRQVVQEAVFRFVTDNPAGRVRGWPTDDGTLPEAGRVKSVYFGASFTAKGLVKTFKIDYLRALPSHAADEVAGYDPVTRSAQVGPTLYTWEVDNAASVPGGRVWVINEFGQVNILLPAGEY